MLEPQGSRGQPSQEEVLSQDTSTATQNDKDATLDKETKQESHMVMQADEVSADEKEIETKKEGQELESMLIKQRPKIEEPIDLSTDLNFGFSPS